MTLFFQHPLTLRIIYLLIIFTHLNSCIFAKENNRIGHKYDKEVLLEIPKDIPDPFFINSDFNYSIPKNIFMTWRNKNLPTNMKKNVELITNLNPEFNIYVFDDTDARNFISKYFLDNVLHTFDSLVPGAYKADLWRYCILYKYGGIYQDIKLEPINRFKYISIINSTIFVKDLKSSGEGIYNAFMISPPGNPIFKMAINKIIENVNKRFYGKSALEPTGPLLLKQFFSKEQLRQLKAELHISNHGPDSIIIDYNHKNILKMYMGYRKEQNKNKTNYYADLWEKKKIYR